MYRKEDVLFQLKIRDAIEKFKNQLGPFLMPKSINFLSHKTVPLILELTSGLICGPVSVLSIQIVNNNIQYCSLPGLLTLVTLQIQSRQ
jgi:hypothetical protein